MTDDELLKQFEATTIPPDRFHHTEHVRVAFIYVSRYPLPEALQKLSVSLRRLADAHGKLERYHETITWAFAFLVHERRQEECWEEFSRRNADLLDWQTSILKKYYRDETLASAKARKIFVLPDKNL